MESSLFSFKLKRSCPFPWSLFFFFCSLLISPVSLQLYLLAVFLFSSITGLYDTAFL